MRRHELDVVSLAAGLLAFAGAVLYLLDNGGVLEAGARWYASLGLIAAGAAAIAGALRSRSDQ